MKIYKFSEIIEEVREYNNNLKYGLSDIVGVTIEKELIPTVANLTQTALDKFYLVYPKTFVYNPRTHGVRIGMGYNQTGKIFITSWNNLAFRVKESALEVVNPDYLWLYFNRSEWDRETNFRAWGSSTIVFSWSIFMDMTIELPIKSIQDVIVRQYSIISERISLMRKINNNLEAQAIAIYHSLFDEQSKWSKGFISDFGDVVGGATPSKDNEKYFCADGIVWLTPKDLTTAGKKFIYKGETDITDVAYCSCSTKLIPKGSILLTSRAPVGCVAIAMTELCTNQGFKSIIPNKEIGTAFVYYFLKENKQLLESHSSGTTFMEISGNVLKKIPVTIPPTELTRKFTNMCRPIFLHQENLEAEIEQLKELHLAMIR